MAQRGFKIWAAFGQMDQNNKKLLSEGSYQEKVYDKKHKGATQIHLQEKDLI
jgi:hypothetical protein